MSDPTPDAFEVMRAFGKPIMPMRFGRRLRLRLVRWELGEVKPCGHADDLQFGILGQSQTYCVSCLAGLDEADRLPAAFACVLCSRPVRADGRFSYAAQQKLFLNIALCPSCKAEELLPVTTHH